jgi:DNA-binding transcriptional MerR regulator
MTNPDRTSSELTGLDRHGPHVGLFGISVVAELTGVAPQTLRLYETKGLLEPDRTPGGTRRYSHYDVERIERIVSLTADGLNLAGIARVLALEAETRRLEAELRQARARTSAARRGP